MSLKSFSYFRLWRSAWAYSTAQDKRDIILYHTMYVGSVAVQLMQPYLFGKLINTLQAGGPNLLHDVMVLLSFIVLASLGNWAFHGPGRIIELKVAKRICIAYTSQCYGKLTEMPLKWHQDHHSGALINRIQTSANSLQSFVGDSFVSFQNLGLLIGSLGMLIWFDPVIGMISFVGFILSMFLIIAMNKRYVSAIHDNNEIAHGANATFYDFVSNMVSIIILRLQKSSEDTLRGKLMQLMSSWKRQIRLNEWRWFVYSMMDTLMLAVILLGYIKMQLGAGGVIAAGSLVTVYLYQEKIGNQGFGFLGTHSEWLRHMTNLAAAENILSDHARLVHPVSQHLAPDWKQINIHGLQFHYRTDEGQRRTVLRDVDLKISHGERIALIGDSGAGKSTLLSLLRALHTPQQVEVDIDGKPAVFAALSEITTLIPQDPEIFENTIRFNVDFGLDVPDRRVHEAIRLAEFTSVLGQMEKGLDTDIREKGVNLSVGQKQRLALARGIFAAEQSDIILLDEPTSSVDLPTEEKIFDNIFEHFHGKTIIATLHRLHLLSKFDRIVYLSAGRVAADMTVKEALATEGPIRRLYMNYQTQRDVTS